MVTGAGETFRVSQTSKVTGRAAGRPYPAAPAAALAGAAPAPVLACEGIEVTQVVQNMAHDVPLVAGKPTVVRVYLAVEGSEFVDVRGTLGVRSPAGQGVWTQAPSLGTVALDPALSGDLRAKREDLGKSLNFLLPAEVTAAGACEVALESLEQVGDGLPLDVPAGAARTVTFVASPPLRLNLVGIRYRDYYGKTYEPRPLDYALIRAWLGRAYPVAEVQWSQIAMDGPKPWPFSASDVNGFLRGLRQRELLSGVDRRTHYFGLVFDGGRGYFMRGMASGIPTGADPSTVASGPTGASDFGWDWDGTYGDWYTAHELAHTLGRYHAEFCGALGGVPYPYPNGQLSGDDGEYAGLDVGAADLGLPMRALPGAVSHDLMTYCDNQWLSPFTYAGIHQRLLDEDALPGAVDAHAGPGGLLSMTSGGIIHVIAAVNLTASTARIQHVTAYPGASLDAAAAGPGDVGAAAPGFSLRLSSSAGDLVDEYPVHVIPDECLDPGDDRTGIIDAAIPNDPAAARIDLLLDGQVLDTFMSAAPAMPPADIHPLGPGAMGLVAGAEKPAGPTLAWTDPGRELHGLVALPGQAPSYTVELSTDGGATWRTAGFGLAEPQVTIDPALLAGVETVQVRVTTTDGFTSESSTTTLKVSELV